MSTKTIFISGGSRGIGEATVREAAGKYNVAFTYLNSRERALALERELNEKYGGVLAIPMRIEDEESVRSAVAAARKRFGAINVLVNNAGVSLSKLLIDTTAEEWRRLMSVNIDGAYLLTREVIGDMLSKGQGSIVNVSSVWGVRGGSGEAAYSASKAAIIGLTRALAKEVAPMGITVNAVAPGAIDTDMMREFSNDEIAALVEEHIPLGRLGRADEVAKAILFLAEQPYISGQTLGVDGLFGA